MVAEIEAKRPRREEKVAFSLKDLEAEVAALRAAPPSYVSEIGNLYRPNVVCDENGKLAETDAELGPFDLQVCLCGKEGDEAYGHFMKVTLRFDHDLWPDKLAIVRFRGVFHHALTDEHNCMTMPFYRSMKRSAEGHCTVALVLESVHDFLVDPFASWNIDIAASPEKAAKIKRALDAHREMQLDRLDIIKQYRKQVLHEELFNAPAKWKEEWLHPDFLQASQANTEEAWRALLSEELAGEVWSFPVFSETFCKLLLDEIFNFYASALPARRPNSMNAYGIILNDIGLEPIIDELQRMVQPLGELLFGGPGTDWDGHHCFIVRYRAGEDLGLDMHTDDSDVTLNICLGLDFTGAGLQFCGVMGAPNHRKHTLTYHHKKGHCVIHLGRKRHGADDISSGERLNLILWNHSSTYRQTEAAADPDYETEEGPPDAVCVSFTHDRDYGNFKEYLPSKEHFRGRGWCPRRGFEYDGFKPDCEKEKKEVCTCGRDHD